MTDWTPEQMHNEAIALANLLMNYKNDRKAAAERLATRLQRVPPDLLDELMMLTGLELVDAGGIDIIELLSLDRLA